MYTQCPECLTIFEIDEDAVQASLGIVHCGHCGRRFDALHTLSDTLPAEPNATLAGQDPVERILALTEVMPPSAFEWAAKKLHTEGDAAQQSVSIELPLPPVADKTLPAEPGPPLPGGGSKDWFEEIETELTSSVIADATDPSSDESIVDNAWQVSDLHAQTRFPELAIPTPFAGAGASYAIGAIALGPCGWIEDDATVTAYSNAPDTVTPNVSADSGLPASAPTEIPFDEIDPPDFEAPGQPPADETAPLWPDELDIDTPIPYDLAPVEAKSASSEPDEAVPTSIPSPLEVEVSDAAETPEAISTNLEPARAEIVSDPAEPLTPVYVRPRRRPVAGIAWTLGCLLLALMLAAQFAWIKRVELFRNPTTHLWATRICQTIDCRLPPIRDVAKLELLSRDIRPDPQAAGALMITATVRNNAAFRQPWPVVVVELTDIDNNPVAMRRFRPAEYMPDPARRAAALAPGATAAVAFEVADPGKRASGFRFSFE